MIFLAYASVLIIVAACMATGQQVDSDTSLFLPALFGPVINRSTLSDTMRGYKTVFAKAYEAATTHSDILAMRVDSKTGQEEYRWLGAFPGLREWLGDRAIKDLAQDGFVIKNQDFGPHAAIN